MGWFDKFRRKRAIPICHDCAYFQGPDRCWHPESVKASLVDGKLSPMACLLARHPWNACGPDGSQFVPKDAK